MMDVLEPSESTFLVKFDRSPTMVGSHGPSSSRIASLSVGPEYPHIVCFGVTYALVLNFNVWYDPLFDGTHSRSSLVLLVLI